MGKHDSDNKKGKKKSTLLIDIIIVILLIVIGYSGYNIARIMHSYNTGTKVYNNVAKEVGMDNVEAIDTYAINWSVINSKYPDVKAWLVQKDTVINYPVVQASDNSYYLYRMINGEYNSKGTPFIDCNCADPFNDFVTIIYGHHMRDKSMFWSLGEYRDQAYYEAHPTFDLLTPDGTDVLEVFACVTMPSDDSLYNVYKLNDEDARYEYINRVYEKNVLDTDVSVGVSDRIVMLSTCASDYENARVVIFCKIQDK